MITWTFPDCLYTCICSYFVIKYSNKHLYCERTFLGHLTTFSLLPVYYSQTDNWKKIETEANCSLLLSIPRIKILLEMLGGF